MTWTRTMLIAGLLLAGSSLSAEAQVPHIIGNWKLNVAASKLPGPPPQTHVRRYSLAPDGQTLIGVAVVVDAQGNPTFLQFAAKPDGKDYPETDARTSAQYLMDGSKSSRTYSETPVDSHTVNWFDKNDGRVIAQGRKWVSADGKTLSFTVDARNQRGETVQYLYVFDRTGT